MEKVTDRFLRYVQIMTPSDEESTTTPTSSCQFQLAELLVKEMKELGMEDARVDEKCYVYGTLPATKGKEQCPALGFIAHMDTVSDFADHQVKPVIHENYDGKTIVLGESGRCIDPADFPELPGFTGRTVITTDGTTMLGADDKAGIAEILTMVETLKREGHPHGKLCIGFTPDEEVGAGADCFDVKAFGADYAYTVDGGKEGEIEFENFNAAAAVVKAHGVNVHPGSAKDIMINAALAAMDFHRMLPAHEIPAETEGYEGFFHLTSMKGEVAEAELRYIIRDHDGEKLEEKLELMRKAAAAVNETYGEGTLELSIKEQYRNMREMIEPHMHLIENARTAAKAVGIVPVTLPIRGGTDGARLSFMGLPCPNLGTGGFGGHGPMEHITVEGMEKTAAMLLELVCLYAK